VKQWSAELGVHHLEHAGCRHVRIAHIVCRSIASIEANDEENIVAK
jgi:hypothetical protein